MNSAGSFWWTIWRIFTSLATLAAAGWVLFRWLKRSEEAPATLIIKWITSLVIGICLFAYAAGAHDEMTKIVAILVAAVCGLFLAILWVPSICGFVAKQFTGLYDGGDLEPEPQPLYSIAEAKRKRGNYLEAVAEIRTQLAKFPGDFNGSLMLAEIQAENLNDLAGAQSTIEHLLTFPEQSPVNLALALNRLADWHLKFGQDVDSARQALERTIQLFPETEQAQLANQRIAHLASTKLRDAKQERTPIALPHGSDNIGLRDDSAGLRPPAEDTAATAADYIKHLEEYPLDNEAREKLALIYAEHYHRLDLATDQLEQLIAAPHQPAKHVAHWLNLLVDLQIKEAGNIAAAQQTLQRIMDQFPNTAAAENALHRMAYLKLELRANEKSQVMKLGSYEQNLGLKSKA